MKKLGLLIAIFTLFINSMASAGIVKGPYLIYRNSPNSMQVIWQISGSDEGSIQWGSTTSYRNTKSPQSLGDDIYAATLTGLSPDSKVYYKVSADGGSYTSFFYTAPSPDANTVTLYAGGDCRSNPSDMNRNFGALLDDVDDAQSSRNTLMLFPGDLVDEGGSESDWQDDFFDRDSDDSREAQARIPLAASVGNHETNGGDDDCETFRKYFPYDYEDSSGDGEKGCYYAYEYGPVHIIVIDLEQGCPEGSSQYNWVENELQNSTKPFRMACYHQPAYSAGDHDDDESEMKEAREVLAPLFKDYNCLLAFSGHNHYYNRSLVDGIHHITTGGMGVEETTPEGAVGQQASSKRFHFCRIECDVATGIANVTVIKTESGDIIESFPVNYLGAGGSDPIVSFAEPAGDVTKNEGDDLYVEVNASDPDGIDRVRLYKDGVELARSEGVTPYEWNNPTQDDPELKNLQEGTFTLTARAIDNEGDFAETSITVTVNGDSSSTNGNFSAIYEAENYTSENDCSEASEYEGYTGTGYMDFGDNGAWVEWDNVNVPHTGEYTLTFHYANKNSDYRESMVKVNGNTVGTMSFANTGSWSDWQTESINVTLTQGNNTIYIEAVTDDGGSNLDHVMVTADSSGGSSSNVFEAENRTSESDCIEASHYEGYTGTGFMDFGANGAWMEWNNINVDVAGEYELVFRYANKNTPYRESMIKVNGVAVGTMPFANTASWEEWQTESIIVTLVQGNNTIFVQAITDDGGPNLDHMLVTSDTSGGGTGGGVINTVFEAEEHTAVTDCTEASEYEGYTGTGYMDFGDNGAWVEWNNVNITEAGEYALRFRYSNKNSDYRESAIKVNGVSMGALAFANTGSWSFWKTDSIIVTLAQGNNTISVEAITDDGGPNLDHMLVTSDTSGGGSGGGTGELLAFPTAEGYGRHAEGGRGGDVYHVTNLNDDGAGSLRRGIDSASGPRTIVFDVSGTIRLQSKLEVRKSYITFAGQTAPGDGITLRGHNFLMDHAEHIIIRYMRFRLGDAVADDLDCITTDDVNHIILDHISASWAIDGTHDLRIGNNFTLQWSLYGEALNDSVHPKGAHAMLMSFRDVQGNISIHHNVFHSSRDRHPSLGGGHYGYTDSIIDFRNNMNFNWDGKMNLGSLQMNIINNYFKPGRSTDINDKAMQIKTEIEDASKGYLRGNFFLGKSNYTADNYDAIEYENDGKYYSTTREKFEVHSEFPVDAPTTHPTADLPDLLLPRVGASLKRDAADERIIAGIIDGSNKLIDSQDEVGGWPSLQSLPAPTDTDRDGMPDAWEIAHGLNPNVKDNNGTDLSPIGYTNLEVYLYSLVGETTQVNTVPIANPKSVTTTENTAKAITLTGSDDDGDPLTYEIVTQPAQGSLSGTAPDVIYTPAANYNGSDSFTFRVNDGTVNSANVTVSITITAVSGYTAWANENGVTGSILDDDDGDGRNNFYEYALGGNPTNALDAGVEPRLVVQNGVLNYLHLKRSDDPSLLYTLESKTDLVNGIWIPSVYTVVGSIPINGQYDEVTNEISSDDPNVFIRLKITEQ